MLTYRQRIRAVLAILIALCFIAIWVELAHPAEFKDNQFVLPGTWPKLSVIMNADRHYVRISGGLVSFAYLHSVPNEIQVYWFGGGYDIKRKFVLLLLTKAKYTPDGEIFYCEHYRIVSETVTEKITCDEFVEAEKVLEKSKQKMPRRRDEI